MTIGRMKIEALKLMFLNARDIHEDDLDTLSADQNYSDYLAAMPGCIHRALQDMVLRKILPLRSRELLLSEGEAQGAVTRFSLSTLIPDLYGISSVICTREGGEEVRIDYGTADEELLLYKPRDGWSYRVVYHPSLPEVTTATPNTSRPDIPETLAAVIPYYIKAELFTTDTPSNAQEAERARVMYETALARYAQERSYSRQRRVKTVFGGW